MTLALWFNADAGESNGGLLHLHDAAKDNAFSLFIAGGSVFGEAAAGAGIGGGGQSASAGAFPTGRWAHAAAVFASTSSLAVFLDGAHKATRSTSATPAGIGRTSLANVSAVGVTNGFLAEAAVWSAALTDAEILLLAQGVLPTQIRPQSLAAYWPLRTPGAAQEFDLNPFARRRYDLAVTGATPADHPDGLLRIPRPLVQRRRRVFAPAPSFNPGRAYGATSGVLGAGAY